MGPIRAAKPFLAVLAATLVIACPHAGVASIFGGSVWWALLSQTSNDDGSFDVEVGWSPGKPEKYEKWKICWRDKADSDKNPCDFNSKVREFENNHWVFRGLTWDGDKTVYRLRLEGLKERNDHWTLLGWVCLKFTQNKYAEQKLASIDLISCL